MDKSKPDYLYIVNAAVAFREIHDKILLLIPDSIDIYELNNTGKTIWQLIQRKQPLSIMIENFSRQYNLSLEKAHKEVKEFLNILEKRKILKKKII